MVNFIRYQSTDPYSIKFGALTEKKVSRTLYPADLLDHWRSFTEMLNEAYDEDQYEFDHDLFSARWIIDICIADKDLNEFDEHQDFKNMVAQIDELFISLTQAFPGRDNQQIPGWKGRLPKKVTRDFFFEESENYLIRAGLIFEIVD